MPRTNIKTKLSFIRTMHMCKFEEKKNENKKNKIASKHKKTKFAQMSETNNNKNQHTMHI